MVDVSIIVTIFNLEAYLEKCVDSIINQTFENIEIILIDDGSVDKSAEICEYYKKIDSRVKVIHKQNGGLVNARKTGVMVAEGKYTIWVDGDDWIEYDYVQNLYNEITRYDTDVVACDLYFDIDNSSSVVKNSIICGEYKISQIAEKMLYSGVFFEYGIQPHIYAKIYKSDLIKKYELMVDERIIAGEDAATVYPLLLGTNKIVVSDVCGYHYVQHAGTMTKKINVNEKESIDILVSYLKMHFEKRKDIADFKLQLNQYKKYLYVLRDVCSLDFKCGENLSIYGEIVPQSRVVIYGAGGVGQRLYQYLKEIECYQIVFWVDQKDAFYKKNNLPVQNPDIIFQRVDEFDYVLVANVNQRTFYNIKGYLLENGIPEQKIKWFCEAILDENKDLRL